MMELYEVLFIVFFLVGVGVVVVFWCGVVCVGCLL